MMMHNTKIGMQTHKATLAIAITATDIILPSKMSTMAHIAIAKLNTAKRNMLELLAKQIVHVLYGA